VKDLVLNFERFVNESSQDDTYVSIVRDTLLRNKEHIIHLTNAPEKLFDEVIEIMVSTRPESLDETNLINDAVAHIEKLKPSIEAEDEWKDSSTNKNTNIPQFEN
jgi:hypothetical protein